MKNKQRKSFPRASSSDATFHFIINTIRMERFGETNPPTLTLKSEENCGLFRLR